MDTNTYLRLYILGRKYKTKIILKLKSLIYNLKDSFINYAFFQFPYSSHKNPSYQNATLSYVVITKHSIKAEISQENLLAPTLYNIFTSDIPHQTIHTFLHSQMTLSNYPLKLTIHLNHSKIT